MLRNAQVSGILAAMQKLTYELFAVCAALRLDPDNILIRE